MSTAIHDVLEAIAPRVHLDLASGTVAVDNASVQRGDTAQATQALSGLLYEHLHVGHHVTDGLDVAASRDTVFEDALARQMSHHSIAHTVPLLAQGTKSAIVRHMGLRVRVPLTAIDLVDGQPAAATLRAPLLAPALSPGFALARTAGQAKSVDGDLLRLYLGASTREDAVESFLAVVDVLVDRSQRWQAKVASQSRLYPRSDAVTVYLHPDDVGLVPAIIDAVPARLGAPASALAHPLAPGVRCAWEPRDPRPGQHGQSFGQHRCAVLARALVAHAQGRPVDLHDLCRTRGIDPAHLWRNTTSPDLQLLHRPVQAVAADLATANL